MSKFENFSARECLVPLVEIEDFSPAFAELAERSIQKYGRVSNSARAMANSDNLAVTARSFLSDIWTGGSLGLELAYLVRLIVSNINTCVYCSTHQVKALAKMGMTKEKIENIREFRSHPAFSERERLALEYGAALTQDSANISDEIAARLVAEFSPEERVELTIIAAGMGMLNRINDGLRVPIEDASRDTAEAVAASFEG
ncbi:carboxymuconolactone decarboxylase family protein [Alphaproteobacteria bacterium]|nr:carboxymuconolactone decarboxylase family protein [Alphaproteobacteria bacterium]